MSKRILYVAIGVLWLVSGCKITVEPTDGADDGECAGQADGTACGDTATVECTLGGVCQNGTCVASYAAMGTSCGSSEASECDGADTCDGQGRCLTNLQADGASCGDSTDTECDGADTCDSQGECSDNHQESGTTCGNSTVTECSLADTCNAIGLCIDNDAALGTPCGDATVDECTAADTCDGTSTCLDNDVTPPEDPWWDATYESRAPIVIHNTELSTLSSTTNVSFSLDHASLVTAGTSQADGSDVRVIYYDDDVNTEIGRVVVNDWNQSTTTLAFALADPISGGSASSGYWLYYNGPTGGTPKTFAPSVQLDGWAIGASDPTDLLTCEAQWNPFYSIQFRQIGRTEFEARIYDATFDTAANAAITVADSDSTVLFNNTYGDYGNIVTSGQHTEAITLTPSGTFTVTATSQETTDSTRYLGCEEHVTTGNTEGSITKQYTLATESGTHPAKVCHLGD